MATYSYTAFSTEIPPIPLMPIQLRTPGLQPRITFDGQSILDTGSDCTLVPLPFLRQVNAQIAGRSIRIPVGGLQAIGIPYTVGIRFDHYVLDAVQVFGCPVEDIGELLIVGRDLMNFYRIEFDGQNSVFTIF